MTDGRAARRSNNLLMIAARDPVPGATKTRLGAVIGMERAAALYRAFLHDLAARFTPPVSGPVAYDLAWTFSPPDCDFRVVLAAVTGAAPDQVHYVPQAGDDWGTRQSNLLRWGHDHGYAHAVLIASDSPHLGVDVIQQAFAALQSHDVTIGRVHDGGYYSIGMRGHFELLAGVPMSTASAADDVVTRARALDLAVAELPPTFDVDEVDDLDRLIAALTPDGVAAPASWAALAELGLIDRRAG
jgi:uncharacterized protein